MSTGLAKDFKLLQPDDVLSKVPKKILSDPSLALNVFHGKLEYGPSTVVRGLKFDIGAEATLSIHAFNNPSDQDEDGILGSDGEQMPPLVLTAGDVWLKYRCNANVIGTVNTGDDVLMLDGDREVIFADYHRHDANSEALGLVLNDLKTLRTPTRQADILSLQPKEALAYRVRGKLTAVLTLTWADVLVGNMAFISAVLRNQTMLGIL
jgi:hypothetical protein